MLINRNLDRNASPRGIQEVNMTKHWMTSDSGDLWRVLLINEHERLSLAKFQLA